MLKFLRQLPPPLAFHRLESLENQMLRFSSTGVQTSNKTYNFLGLNMSKLSLLCCFLDHDGPLETNESRLFDCSKKKVEDKANCRACQKNFCKKKENGLIQHSKGLFNTQNEHYFLFFFGLCVEMKKMVEQHHSLSKVSKITEKGPKQPFTSCG